MACLPDFGDVAFAGHMGSLVGYPGLEEGHGHHLLHFQKGAGMAMTTISFIPREEERVTMPKSSLSEKRDEMVAMALSFHLQERREEVTMTVSSLF